MLGLTFLQDHTWRPLCRQDYSLHSHGRVGCHQRLDCLGTTAGCRLAVADGHGPEAYYQRCFRHRNLVGFCHLSTAVFGSPADTSNSDVVVGIVRIVALSNLAPPPGDWTHSLAPVEIWSYIEAGTVICIANIPLCKPIAERIMPRTFLTWAKRSYGRSGYTPNPRSGKNQPSESAGRKFEDDEFQLFPGKGGNHAVSARRDLESGPIGREWQHLDDVDSLEHDGIRMTQNITVTEERAR